MIMCVNLKIGHIQRTKIGWVRGFTNLVGVGLMSRKVLMEWT
jgi:hypothetical protein